MKRLTENLDIILLLVAAAVALGAAVVVRETTSWLPSRSNRCNLQIHNGGPRLPG